MQYSLIMNFFAMALLFYGSRLWASAFRAKRRKRSMCLASLTQATSPQSEPEVSKAQVQTIEAQIQANEDQSRAIIEAQAQAIEALIQATEAQIQAIEAQSRTSQAIEAQTQTSKRRRTRGPTLCKDLYWLEPGKRLKVILNEYSQPVGKSAIKLTQFLGTIARNGHNFPIDIPEWRNMPASKKEEAWKVVLVSSMEFVCVCEYIFMYAFCSLYRFFYQLYIELVDVG